MLAAPPYVLVPSPNKISNFFFFEFHFCFQQRRTDASVSRHTGSHHLAPAATSPALLNTPTLHGHNNRRHAYPFSLRQPGLPRSPSLVTTGHKCATVSYPPSMMGLQPAAPALYKYVLAVPLITSAHSLVTTAGTCPL